MESTNVFGTGSSWNAFVPFSHYLENYIVALILEHFQEQTWHDVLTHL